MPQEKSIKITNNKFYMKCPQCGNDISSFYLVKDIPCPNCDFECNLMENFEVKEIITFIGKNDIKIKYDGIFYTLTVSYICPFLLEKDGNRMYRELFTIHNPRIRDDFPQFNFPSEYHKKENKNKVKSLILNNYKNVFEKLI